ncbi:hypothetical protein Plim_3676 [Planctopirus limnophila DSM 3776]|jgi:hypothetical protein|uniref:GYF domain-containing protein n=2 Tax=Planctopirus TaxID=1649480 RepID=D5SVX8_PLAL2|nr:MULTISPECIES: GYF domain-containing protein [Planctopirus]ADG69488.1 hypothetical protein Plim_3676 [Planctopirus limnophila DSM 3776]QDV28400.1 hypothetical protein Spb1_02630 [Planctopirus ephydatiae]
MKIHLHVNGKKQGPFELEEVNSQIAEGVLLPGEVSAWYKGCEDWMPLEMVPGIEIPAGMNVPPVKKGGASSAEKGGDSTGGLIPYKNPSALIAYYLGIFGLFPLFGLVFSIPAFILGIVGLYKRSQNPVIKGSVHAWIGIVLGFIATTYNGLLAIGVIIAISQNRF